MSASRIFQSTRLARNELSAATGTFVACVRVHWYPTETLVRDSFSHAGGKHQSINEKTINEHMEDEIHLFTSQHV